MLSLFGLLFASLLADLLPQREVYEGAGRLLLPLLATLGFAGCLGYLSIHLARRPGCTFLAGPSFTGPELSGGSFADVVTLVSGRWPLLVALLFGPLPVLFAGLGGWV